MAPKGILEIRWHGRGGQGAKTAAQLLAETALEEGKYIQSFPEYGPERAGAPMKAFTRISEDPINLHCSVTTPGIVVVLDSTLLDVVNVVDGLGEEGFLLINTDKTPVQVREKLNFYKGKVYTVNATKIALGLLGIPLPNMPMLGALIKTTGIVPQDKLEDKFKKKFLKKIGEEKTKGNIEAVRQVQQQVQSG